MMPRIPTHQGFLVPQGAAVNARVGGEVLDNRGEALAGLGQIVQQVGAVQKQADREFEAQKRQIEDYQFAAKVEADATAEWEKQFTDRSKNIGDNPDQFAEAIKTDFDAYKKNALSSAPSANALLMAQRSLDGLGQHYESNARAVAEKTKTTRAITGIDNSANELLNAVALNPDSYDAAHSQIVNLVRSIEPQVGEDVARELETRYTQEATRTRFLSLIDQDPQAALRQINSGAFNTLLDPNDLIRLKGGAETEIKRREAEARARQREYEADLRARARDALDVWQLGFKPDGWDQLVKEAGNTEIGRNLVQFEADQYSNQQFALGSLDEQAAWLQSETARLQSEGADPHEAGIIQQRQNIYANLLKQAQTDPLALAARQGLVAPAPLDFTNPDSLRQRVEQAGIASQHYGVDALPFTRQEMSNLSAAIGKANTEGKTQILGWLTAGLGTDKLPGVMAALEKDGGDAQIFAIAGATAQEDQNLAETILAGSDAQKQLKIAPSSTQQWRAAMNDTIGPVFTDYQAAIPGIRQAVESIYAQMSVKAGDLSGEFDQSRFDQATQAVLGDIVTYNGQPIVAPRRGMVDADVEDLIEGATVDDLGPVKPTTKDGTPLSLQKIKDEGVLVTVGNGRYRVKINDKYAVDPTNGSPWEWDLSKVEPKASIGPAYVTAGKAGKIRVR